ncbi:MoxR family ATPase [Roseibacillus persicicus]
MPELPTPDPSFAMLTQIRKQIERVFVGQEKLVEYVLVAFVSGGHVLIEGHPGLGKTHLVLSLAETFHGVFKRIQFTPDLMPSDVTGHSIFDMAKQSFQVKQGPVFTNLLLADEVNRAPAKTQSALLEVMQERQATIDGVSYPLPKPFMVLATQNPVEQDGTYPLPEAQLDRFMMKLLVDEPGLEDEILIATRATRSGMESLAPEQIDTVCSPEDIEQLRESLTSITISPSVIRYAVQLVQATRSSEMTSYGASPRASISLVQAAKGFAMLRERDFVVPDDVKGCALQVLRHRIRLTPEVAISGQTVDETVAAIINSVEAPRQ